MDKSNIISFLLKKSFFDHKRLKIREIFFSFLTHYALQRCQKLAFFQKMRCFKYEWIQRKLYYFMMNFLFLDAIILLLKILSISLILSSNYFSFDSFSSLNLPFIFFCTISNKHLNKTFSWLNIKYLKNSI